jgi:hypothetical protein
MGLGVFRGWVVHSIARFGSVCLRIHRQRTNVRCVGVGEKIKRLRVDVARALCARGQKHASPNVDRERTEVRLVASPEAAPEVLVPSTEKA